jgi:hypothetical protein
MWSGCAAVGGVVMAVGGMSTAWWSAPLGLDIGLRGARVCLGEQCEATTLALVLAGQTGFRVLAAVTWLLCLVGGAALVIGAALLWLRDRKTVLARARWVGVAGFALAVLAVGLFPGEDVSIGWGFWATVLGAVTAFVGGTLATAPVVVDTAPFVVLPRVEVRPERSGPVIARGSTSGRFPVDLRFVVQRLTIGETGLEAEMTDGSTRSLPWRELGTLFVGQLPVDPPYEKRVFLDLVPRSGGAPLRLLATTRANYDAMGGAAATSTENFRRLAVHARENNPGLAVDHVTRAFVHDKKSPRQFLAHSQFVEYDTRYGG